MVLGGMMNHTIGKCATHRVLSSLLQHICLLNARAFGAHDYNAQLCSTALLVLRIKWTWRRCRLAWKFALLGKSGFPYLAQTRTGLLSYPLEENVCTCSSFSQYLFADALKPHIIHIVVSHRSPSCRQC